MANLTIVGSGASGLHFALTALEKGHQVTMLDVGKTGPSPENPQLSYNQLKCRLLDPVDYFLGKEFESVIPPDYDKEIYEFPPNKQYIFDTPGEFKYKAAGFEPLFSFAAGGLAQAWTGGSYPFNDNDLEEFPFEYKDIGSYYETVSQRIGIIGTDDDLADYFPLHDQLLPPIRFDAHSQILVDKYLQKRDKLIQTHGVRLGRSRVAVLSENKGDRPACDYSGRCLWGCPTDSLYVPAITLEQCKTFSNFKYLPNHLVSHFTFDPQKTISKVSVIKPGLDETVEYPVDILVLAAGALSTSKIYLDSIYHQSGEILKLPGLMDNRQVLVPFINPAMLGQNYNPKSYQYHQLAIGFEWGEERDYVHGQVTTLKTALMQPVLQGMPLDWQTATHLGRNLHSALGVVNINYSDCRRQENYVSIEPVQTNGEGLTSLDITYSSAKDEHKKITETLKKVKKFFKSLGVIVPPGQTHIRPMGASVHYSGTLPMTSASTNGESEIHTLDPFCKSNYFKNLYVVDGAAFPFLPAKNLTLTLMANAARVADSI